MAARRKIEIFSTGCQACRETIELIHLIACPTCEITVLDMNDPTVAARARSLGVRSVPAVAIDGMLADCIGRDPKAGAPGGAGIGQSN